MEERESERGTSRAKKSGGFGAGKARLAGTFSGGRRGEAQDVNGDSPAESG